MTGNGNLDTQLCNDSVLEQLNWIQAMQQPVSSVKGPVGQSDVAAPDSRCVLPSSVLSARAYRFADSNHGQELCHTVLKLSSPFPVQLSGQHRSLSFICQSVCVTNIPAH